MKVTFHARFCSGGGTGDRPPDHNGTACTISSNTIIVSCTAVGMVLLLASDFEMVSCNDVPASRFCHALI